MEGGEVGGKGQITAERLQRLTAPFIESTSGRG